MINVVSPPIKASSIAQSLNFAEMDPENLATHVKKVWSFIGDSILLEGQLEVC